MIKVNDFNKIVRIGVQGKLQSTYCKIKYEAGELSISGVEGPNHHGGCRGSCGQINLHYWNFTNFAPGWNGELVSKFRRVWHEWHLNGMQAGSPAQRAYLDKNPINPYSYDAAKEALRAAGLEPDASYMHNGKPYSYGSAWLKKKVPVSVLRFLKSLPDADKTPAWV